jgi:dTDP-4-amino-4,6-dideoxygalactose transaminase
LAADIEPGDEVITSTMTFVATANAIVLTGATPVLVDCDPDTLNVDLEAVEKRIGPRTKAIVPVHFAGQPCPMRELLEISSRHGLVQVEDAAHALGTEYEGRKIGAFGDMAVFSFHPIKAITTGEGGMVVSRNPEWARKIRLLRFHGIETTAWQRHAGGRSAGYAIGAPGFKYAMMDLQAALGIHQMDRIEGFLSRRAVLADAYQRGLKGLRGITPLGSVPYPHRHAWHLFIAKLELERLDVDRDSFLDLLSARNIGGGIHFPTVHTQPYYRDVWGYRRGDFPNAEWVSGRIISLPLFPAMEEGDVEDVVEAIAEILEERWRD